MAQQKLQLDDAKSRVAQLEDELSLANEHVKEAYEFTKPPITIDTGSNYSSGGDLALPAPVDKTLANAVVVVASVLGFVLTLWILLRKGK